MLRAAIALLCALLAFGFTSRAQAFDVATKWYTITVQSSSTSVPPLFLTNESQGVTLERYRSGDVTQMWTTVNLDYPTIPAVTSGSGIDFGGIFDCLTQVLSGGCSFHGHAGVTAKVVNRASGGCLLLSRTGAQTKPCAVSGNDSGWQRWQLTADPKSGGFGMFVGSSGQGKCLTSEPAARSPDFHTVYGDSCNGKGVARWSQLFTMQLVAELACQTDYWHICFVNGKQ